MTLRVLENAVEGRNLLHRPPVGDSRELLGRLRCSDWASLCFSDERVWGRRHLEDVVFWLEGGKYVAGPRATAEQGEDTTRVPDSASADAFAVLADFPREDLVERVRSAYLGPLSSGQISQLTPASLAQRVRRVASAWSNESESDRRGAVGRSLDGFLLLSSSPEELKVVGSALAALNFATRAGRSFRARSPVDGKARLVDFFDECNPASSFNGFICAEFKSVKVACEAFTESWTLESVAGLSGYESSALVEKLGIAPTSPRSANRCLMSLIQGRVEPEPEDGGPGTSASHAKASVSAELPAARTRSERPPPLAPLEPSGVTESESLPAPIVPPRATMYGMSPDALEDPSEHAAESGFGPAEIEALRSALGNNPKTAARGHSRQAGSAPKAAKTKRPSQGEGVTTTALAELLRQAGVLPGSATDVDESNSESDGESETSHDPPMTLLEMLKPKTTKGPTGRLLTSEAQKELEQLPEDLKQGFAEFWEENCTGVTGKKRTESLRLIYEERKRVAELMTAQRQLSSGMIYEGKIRRKHWTTGLAHDPVESILAAEVNERLTAGSLKIAFSARAGSLALGKGLMEQYHASVRTVCLLADCLEPWEFLNNPAAESAMRRIVVLEEASRLKESVGVDKVMTKNAGFLGTAGELSERTWKQLS